MSIDVGRLKEPLPTVPETAVPPPVAETADPPPVAETADPLPADEDVDEVESDPVSGRRVRYDTAAPELVPVDLAIFYDPTEATYINALGERCDEVGRL